VPPTGPVVELYSEIDRKSDARVQLQVHQGGIEQHSPTFSETYQNPPEPQRRVQPRARWTTSPIVDRGIGIRPFGADVGT